MQWLIFLAGTYQFERRSWYHLQCREGGRILSVDGALQALQRLEIRPDLIVGDMDSVDPGMLADYGHVEQVILRQDKNVTDGEAAVREAFTRGASSVVLIGGIDNRFETDQLLGNLFLLSAARHLAGPGCDCSIHMADPTQAIWLVENQTFMLEGNSGDLVSVIPLSDSLTLSYQGLSYPLQKFVTHFGDTRCLRNQLINTTAAIEVSGRALVVRQSKVELV